jgi:hypothetical protein
MTSFDRRQADLKEVDIMLNRVSRLWLVGSIWFAALAGLIATSVAMGATLSTSALLFVLGTAPVAVMVLIRAGAPSPTVAEILHEVNVDDRRR